jgi:hypothetical protein
MSWRQTPTRVAWLILSASFTVCCLLAVIVPLGVRSFLLHATRGQAAFVEATDGTVQLMTDGSGDARAVTERRAVPEGSQLATDASAKGLLTVSADDVGDHVLATVQLWQNSAVKLLEARTPRFALSSDPHRLKLNHARGRLFLAIQRTDERDVEVELDTPQGSIWLGTGAYDVSLDGDTAQVRVRSGEAQVRAGGQEVTAGSGQRVSVSTGTVPDLPVPDTVNLVLNGNFEGSLEPLWTVFAEVKPGHDPGTAELWEEGRRTAVRLSRKEEDGVPNRVGVVQTVDRDVQGYDSLALRLDLNVMSHSVPGGGEKATEYPVMVDLFYTDIYGKDLHWYQGFYQRDLPAGSPYLPPTGEKVPLGIWYTYESPNLFEALQATRPARINSISIYASGHDYDSLVTDVALTVR